MAASHWMMPVLTFEEIAKANKHPGIDMERLQQRYITYSGIGR